MTHERSLELLCNVVDDISFAGNSHTSIRKLMEIGFSADELIEEYGWSLTDVQDVESEFLVEELAELVDIEFNSELEEDEKSRYLEIVKLLQERNIEIPFGIEI